MPRNFQWKGGKEKTNLSLIKERFYGNIFEEGRLALPGSGGDNLRDIIVLRKAFEVQEAVCQLSIGPGTGFMISENILLTCHHVLRSKERAKRCRAIFDFQLDIDQKPMQTREYKLDPDSLKTDDELLTAVRVEGEPLKGRKCIKIKDASPQKGDSALIIQHPNNYGYKKIALGDIEIKFESERELQYLSDTMPGSSGSPIFDSDLNLIGIHSDGGFDEGARDFSRNLGIHVKVIIKFLKNMGLEDLVV